MLVYTNFTQGIRVKLFDDEIENQKDLYEFTVILINLEVDQKCNDDVEIRKGNRYFDSVTQTILYVTSLYELRTLELPQ